MVIMTVNANAVNGNGQSTGDNWNSIIIQLPGAENYDSIDNPSAREHDLTWSSKIILLFGLATILFLAVKIFKD